MGSSQPRTYLLCRLPLLADEGEAGGAERDNSSAALAVRGRDLAEKLGHGLRVINFSLRFKGVVRSIV